MAAEYNREKERSRKAKRVEERHIKQGTLFGKVIKAGYDQKTRHEIWHYFNHGRWDEKNPAKCTCEGKGTCWICDLNALRSWADMSEGNSRYPHLLNMNLKAHEFYQHPTK